MLGTVLMSSSISTIHFLEGWTYYAPSNLLILTTHSRIGTIPNLTLIQLLLTVALKLYKIDALKLKNLI